METFKKIFTRDAPLLYFEVWHKAETEKLSEWLNWNIPQEVFENRNGAVSFYIGTNAYKKLDRLIIKKLKQRKFLNKVISYYLKRVRKVEKRWLKRKVLKKKEELKDFFEEIVAIWPGLSIIYQIPNFPKGVVKKNIFEKSLQVRQLTEDFFENCKDIFIKTVQSLYPDVKEFARYLSIQEVSSGTIPSKNELKKRARHYIFLDGKIIVGQSLDEVAKRNNFHIQKEGIKFLDLLKGQIVNKGKTRGIAKIILTKSDFEKVKKGDILVTSMTSPSFLPIMKKAAAFVTDEGGLTCHAAIIAREMNKPCIIGTKIATRVLKDGDLVEVDADKGIVRKLK